MYRLSSNFTIVLKLFLPTLWLAFFGLFGLALIFSDPDNLGIMGFPSYKIGYFIFFLGFATLMYFTIFQLKRVESHGTEIYVTDYFKTVKIGVGNIRKVSEINLLLFTLVTFHLKTPGTFGKKITFVAKNANYGRWLIDHASYLRTLEE